MVAYGSHRRQAEVVSDLCWRTPSSHARQVSDAPRGRSDASVTLEHRWREASHGSARRFGEAEESVMVPVEATAFGLLAVCVIMLALLLFFTLLFPRDSAMLARSLLVPALVIVVILAIYVLVTTRVR